MIINNILKNSVSPSNTGLLKLSFWVIASLLVIHIDTFITFTNLELNLGNVKNLVMLFPFMLISLFCLKLIRLSVLFFDNLLSVIFNGKFSFLDFNTDKDKLSLNQLRDYSISNNNSTLYKHYESLKNDCDEKIKRYEFTAYLFIIILTNLIVKGSIFSYFNQNNILKLQVFVAILSLIYMYMSLDVKEEVDKGLLDKKTVSEIESYHSFKGIIE